MARTKRSWVSMISEQNIKVCLTCNKMVLDIVNGNCVLCEIETLNFIIGTFIQKRETLKRFYDDMFEIHDCIFGDGEEELKRINDIICEKK